MTDVHTERRADPPQQFHQRVGAAPEQLITVRDALRAWAAGLGLTAEQQEDLILAAYEAMANSSEHGYRDHPEGLIDVLATYQGGTVTVTVTDHGVWKTPDPTDSIRGRGLILIDRLAHESECVRRDDGTTVTMSWHL